MITSDEVFHTVVAGISMILLGSLIIASHHRRWDWYFEIPRVTHLEELLGDKGFKIFYTVSGILCIVLGLIFILGLLF